MKAQVRRHALPLDAALHERVPDVALFRLCVYPVCGLHLYVGPTLHETHALHLTTLHERVAHAAPIAVFGRPISGKTHFLQLAASAIAFHHTPDAVQIAAIGAGLGWLAAALHERVPHVAMPVAATPPELGETIDKLVAALDRRSARAASRRPCWATRPGGASWSSTGGYLRSTSAWRRRSSSRWRR